jgi:transposase
MPKKHTVRLTAEERTALVQLTTTGKVAARTLTRAHILLKADAAQEGGSWSNEAIAVALNVGTATVERVRHRFAESGWQAALYPKPRPKRAPTKMDGAAEAHLIALTCSAPPDGQKRWTLRLLANGMVEAGYLNSLSHEAVRQTLKKMNSSPG